MRKQSYCFSYFRFLRRFARKSSNIDFFSETFTSLRLWVTHVKNVKKMGGSPNSFRRYDVQKITQNLRNRASLLHTDKAPVCAKSL